MSDLSRRIAPSAAKRGLVAAVACAALLALTWFWLFPPGENRTFANARWKQYGNRLKWVIAPDVIREFPPGRTYNADAFQARLREWIPVGTSEGSARSLMWWSGFRADPGGSVDGKDAYLWSYDADVFCGGAGYGVAFRYQEGRVTSVSGGYRGPAFCQ